MNVVLPDFKALDYETLIDVIRLTQKELKKRGTVTQCFNIFYTEEEKQKMILITDKPFFRRVQP